MGQNDGNKNDRKGLWGDFDFGNINDGEIQFSTENDIIPLNENYENGDSPLAMKFFAKKANEVSKNGQNGLLGLFFCYFSKKNNTDSKKSFVSSNHLLCES